MTTFAEAEGLTPAQIEAFWMQMDRPAEGCWLWKGGVTTAGYGAARINGKQYTTHRLAWSLRSGGAVPAGMHVCHRCDVRLCSRPDHLFLGTAADNARDSAAKGRRPRGEAHHGAVVNADLVRLVRRLYDPGDLSLDEITRRTGVNRATVHQIGKRRTWLHVPEADGRTPVPVPAGVSRRYGRAGKTPTAKGRAVPLPGLGQLTPRQFANFWAKVDRKGPEECWPWRGSHSGRGYGRFGFAYRLLSAHRVAWLLHSGEPIADGMMVCHRCDNPPCCNPAHLFLGTAQRNADDCSEKRHRPRGEAHSRSKLTEEKVRAIRSLRGDGLTLAQIAAAVGVGPTAVAMVLSGRTWRHV